MAEFRLGIHTFSFNYFGILGSLQDVIDMVKKTGVKYIEMMPRELTSPDKDEAVVKKNIEIVTKAGLTIDSCGICGFSKNEEDNRKTLKYAKMAGIKALTSWIEPDAIELTEEMAKEYDIKLAIHNHGKQDIYGTVEKLQETFKMTGPIIGSCLDTAWIMETGKDPVEVAKMFGDRL